MSAEANQPPADPQPIVASMSDLEGSKSVMVGMNPDGTVQRVGDAGAPEPAAPPPQPSRAPMPTQDEHVPPAPPPPPAAAPAPDAPAAPGDQSAGDPPAELSKEDAAAQEVMKAAQIDVLKVNAEIAETGTLSPDTYNEIVEKVSKIGISKDIVDEYMSGRNAKQELFNIRLYDAVGGEQEWRDAVRQAPQFLSEQEIAAFNKEANKATTNPERGLELGKWLYAQYKESGFYKGKAVVPDNGAGAGAAAAGGDVYQSQDEYSAAMADPRYTNDTAYRTAVRTKMLASLGAGTIKI